MEFKIKKHTGNWHTHPPPSCLSSGCQGHTALVKMSSFGNSKVVQGLGCQALTAEILGSIPGQGNKIQQAKLNGQEKKKEQPSRRKAIEDPPLPRVCMPAKSLQSCLTLCDPVDCISSSSSVHGILQARIREWVAISSSRESSQPRDGTRISYVSSLAGGFINSSTRRPLSPQGSLCQWLICGYKNPSPLP